MNSKKEVTGFRLVFGYLGIFMVLIGFLTFVPTILVAFHPEEASALRYFWPVSAFDIGIGLLLFFTLLFRRPKAPFRRYEDSSLLFIVWLLALLSGAFPFLLAFIGGDMPNMNFSAAFFESTSAYTSTGQTAFADYVDLPSSYCPYVYCFHRSLMQFIGGIGLVLVLTMVLGKQGNVALYSAEGHNDKLLPSLGRSSKLIFGIYSLYTAIGTVVLWLFGLPWFDAVNTSMCALAGGGMSVRSSNIGFYKNFEAAELGKMQGAMFPLNSMAVEITVDVLVFLSAISFVLHLLLLTGKLKKLIRDDELRYMGIIMVGAILTAFFGACQAKSLVDGGAFFEDAAMNLRDSSFTVIAAGTTSGFVNTSLTDMVQLGRPMIYLCIILMLVGGGAGSTAGGIKQFRIVICLKSLYYSMRYRFAPSNEINPRVVRRHGKLVDLTPEMEKEAFTYTLLFLCVFMVSVVILGFVPDYGMIGYDGGKAIMTGLDGITAASFDVASAMSNTGLSVHNYVDYMSYHPEASHVVFWVLSLDMFLGRLEILPLVYAGKNTFEEARYMVAKRVARRRESRTIDPDVI